jgi:hypothetical protein
VSSPAAQGLQPARSGPGGAQKIVTGKAIDHFPSALATSDYFGYATASLGDLDGDGRVELAVGAGGDDDGTRFDYDGAVWILSLESDGRVSAFRKIGPVGGGFGFALDALGDLDGDGVRDLAAGAYYAGSVWILFLNADGSVKGQTEIASGEPGFGRSLAHLGDLDGDGFPELAVGHPLDDDERGTVALLSLNPDGSVHAQSEIGQGLGGFGGTLDPDDYFGSALSELADLDGDLVPELAVGAYGDDGFVGAVWILFLNADGSVKGQQRIDDASGGFSGTLEALDFFGGALAALDDADGDGLPELAVGASGTADVYRGAVWILFLDSSGSVKREREIAPPHKVRSPVHGFDGRLEAFDSFGGALGLLDDLDGDGVRELAVGAYGDGLGPCGYVGAVWILFMDSGAAVRSERKLAPDSGLPIPVEPYSLASAAALGDLDGDGAGDLALGARTDCLDAGGAVWTVHLDPSAEVVSATRIASGRGGFSGVLAEGDGFGASTAALGDLDLDGVPDLAVGAPGADLGGLDRGVVWILFLEADGTVRDSVEIGQSMGGFSGPLRNRDAFGAALSALDDLDQDGVVDLAVGAPRDDDGGTDRGAAWILFLRPDGTVKAERKISQTQGGFPGSIANGDLFGSAVAATGDVDGDLVPDLAVGAPFADTGQPEAGEVWTLLLNADGSVKGATAFDPTLIGHSPREDDYFGGALAGLGDLDLDGRPDLAVGSPGDDGTFFFGDDEGALWMVSLAADGSASSMVRTTQPEAGIARQDRRDGFGALLARLPDFDGDGVEDLGVGLEDFFRLWILHP